MMRSIDQRARCGSERWAPTLPSAVACTALLVTCLGCLLGCRSDKAAPELTSPSTEPERFSFALPAAFEQVELRGEGSERLRVPAGARVVAANGGFAITSGDEFDIQVLPDAPALSELVGGVAPILNEKDLAIWKSGSGYSFVVVRELVPEWDENQSQRLSCGSAGGAVRAGATRADARGFSKPAVQAMVAACRSLELPKLE